jgi:hypothetical protein
MRDDRQPWHTSIVATIVSYQRQAVEKRCGGDPSVRTLNTVSPGSCCNGHLSPLGTKLPVERQDHERVQLMVRPVAACLAPVGLDRPPVQFRNCHEREHKRVASELRIVEFGDGMVLEEEGNYVSVNYKAAHAAGSDLLDWLWPRHACSAARKSSIASSSGQKLPCSTRTSLIGPLPCWAISSSSVGCASKLWRGSFDLGSAMIPY